MIKFEEANGDKGIETLQIVIKDAVQNNPNAIWDGLKTCPETFQPYVTINGKNYTIEAGKNSSKE